MGRCATEGPGIHRLTLTRGLIALALIATACDGPREVRGTGERIRIGIRQPGSLDPVHLTDSSSTAVARQIYEPLLRLDPETLEVQAGIASRTRMSEGGSRFTFEIRQGVRFHNGKALTRDDVLFSLNRLVRKQTASESAFLLEPVAGFEAVRDGTANDLEGLRPAGRSGIEVRLKAPWVEFPLVLAHPATSIVPKGLVEATPSALKTKPMGTGPYAAAGEIAVGSDILLKRFTRYVGTHRASIDEIAFLIYESGAYGDLENGRIDIAEAPIAQAAAAKARFGGAGFSPRAAGLYLGVNTAAVPDARMRRVMSLALDRESIARSVFGGTLVPADSLVPPVLESGGRCATLCRYSPASAASLLKEASPAGGPTLRTSFVSRDTALFERIRPMLASAGITLEARSQDLANFSSSLVKQEDPLFILGWVAEYASPDWFLNLLLRTGSPDNHSGYGSAELDLLLTQARAEADDEQRKLQYARVEEKALDDMVLVPIGFFTNRLAASPRVQGLKVDALGFYDVSRMRLS